MRTRRRFLVAVLATAGAFAIVGSPAPAPAAEGSRVSMVDNEPDLTAWHFDPAQLTVPAGSTVVWFNKGKEDHSVTADDRSFDSGMKKTGTSWQRAFPRMGTYAYHCDPHPWMTGTVKVVAASTPTSAAATTPGSEPPTTPGAGPAATTFPPSQATQATPKPPDTTTSAPPAASGSPSSGSGDNSAAPAASRKRSGGHLAATIALVLGPTLAGLALGAKLRRAKS